MNFISYSIYNSKFYNETKELKNVIKFFINKNSYFYLSIEKESELKLFCKGKNKYGQLGIGIDDKKDRHKNTIHPFFINKKMKIKFISNGLQNDHIFIYTTNNKS